MKFSLLLILVIFSFGNAFSQTKDSLHPYPAIFSTSTSINFDLEKTSVVTLEIFDRTGVIIKTFYKDASLPSGYYFETFSGNSIKDEIYLVHLQINQNTSLKQIIVKNSSLGLSEKNPQISNLTISPNPFSNQITIPLEGSKKIEIKDLAGKIVHSIVTEETTISLSKLLKGEYLISIYSIENQLITSQKIVKID